MNVTLKYKSEEEAAGTEIQTVHLPEGEEPEVLSSRVKESGEQTEVRFTSDSFSVYGIVYTVDFHWEVNGKIDKRHSLTAQSWKDWYQLSRLIEY